MVGTDVPTSADVTETLLCNGAKELCDRRLNEVALPGSHNSMSNQDDGFLLPNQPHSMIRQLDDGIRGMLFDVHPADDHVPDEPPGTAMLCHGDCAFGHQRLDTVLTQIRLWLEAHPHEILMWVIEDYVPEEAITLALQTSQLLPLCLHHAPNTPFPTLRELIAQNKRVFIMRESGGGPADWDHGYEDVMQDNPYSAETVADFACNRLRGKAGNPLLNVNHFLTRGLTGHEGLAEEANHNPQLRDHVLKCQQQFGQIPNIVAVDWYTIGDLLAVVKELNGLP